MLEKVGGERNSLFSGLFVPMKSLSQRVVDDYLSDGRIKIGDKLPPIPELAKRYQVSAPTMGKALGILQVQGILEGRRGSGVYVIALPSQMSTRSEGSRFSIGLVGSSVAMTNPIFQGVLHGATRRQLNLQVASSEWNYHEEKRLVSEMIAGGVDGILLYPVLAERDSEHDYLRDEFAGFPMVVLDTPVPGVERSRVVFDNWSAGYEMTRLLLERGHRHIAFMHLLTPVPTRSIEDRLAGFLRAMEEAKIPREEFLIQDYHSPGRLFTDRSNHSVLDFFDHILESNREAVAELIAQRPEVTAVISPSDAYAKAFLRIVGSLPKAKGRKLPVVVGFDNARYPDWRDRFLTTSPDFGRMGERAVDLLILEMEERERCVREWMLPCPIYRPPGLEEAALLPPQGIAKGALPV